MRIYDPELKSVTPEKILNVSGNDLIRSEISGLMSSSGIGEYIERERILIVTGSDNKKIHIELELAEDLAILPFIRFADMLGQYLAHLTNEPAEITNQKHHRLWTITEDPTQQNYRVRYQCRLPHGGDRFSTNQTVFVPLSANEIFSS